MFIMLIEQRETREHKKDAMKSVIRDVILYRFIMAKSW